MNPFDTIKKQSSDINNISPKTFVVTKESNKDLNRIKFITKKLRKFRVVHFKPKNWIYSNNNNSKKGRWTLKEHIEFLKGIDKYGKDLKKIKINSRSLIQLRSHAQKFFISLKKVKDTQLGINFTSNSIKNIKDMVDHIKSVNNEYNIVYVFLYLSEKYNQKNEKLNENENYITHDNIQKNKEISIKEEENCNIELSNYKYTGEYTINTNINIINDIYAYNHLKNIQMNNLVENLKNINHFLDNKEKPEYINNN